MTRTEIKKTVLEALLHRRLCRFYLRFYDTYDYYYPLMMSERLFLGAEEDDFLLDGYIIRRFQDVTRAEVRTDLCETISRREGIIDSIVVPDLDLSSWQTIFESLRTQGKNIIVEKESARESERDFAIGRIERVSSHAVWMRHFDADGIWLEETWRIPFTDITSVTFDSRYVEVFSNYVGEPPVD